MYSLLVVITGSFLALDSTSEERERVEAFRLVADGKQLRHSPYRTRSGGRSGHGPEGKRVLLSVGGIVRCSRRPGGPIRLDFGCSKESVVFFEKKNQKTLANRARSIPRGLGARHHMQRAHTAQQIDQCFRQSIRDLLLGRLPAHVGEGENGDGMRGWVERPVHPRCRPPHHGRGGHSPDRQKGRELRPRPTGNQRPA